MSGVCEVQKRIEVCSQQIEVEPTNCEAIKERSQLFRATGDLDSAIADISKVLMLDPRSQNYAERSSLYRQKQMYSQAAKDYEEATSASRSYDLEQKSVESEYSNFLHVPVYYDSIATVRRIADQYENIVPKDHQSREFYRQAFDKLLDLRLDYRTQKLSLQADIREELRAEMLQLKESHENKLKELQQYHAKIMAKLKQGNEYCLLDYEHKLRDEIEQMSPGSQEKLLVYFRAFTSEAEKYYVAAKHLRKFDDKSIRFEDFQSILAKKNSDFWKRLYKFFDKYSTKVDQIEAVVREVPYIGSVFRLLKHAMHAKGWQEETNLELQCENIERIAADTTSFNQCSNALAYHLVRKYREYIVLPHKFNHTLWDNLTRQFHCSKVLHLGKEQYKHHFTQELACVQEIAMIHASIVMVAAACNQLLFTATQVKHIYQLYASGDIQQADLELHDLIHTIDTVETVLKQETKFTLQPNDTSQTGSSKCLIF